MRDAVSLEIKTPKKTELNLGNTKIVGGEGENGATFYPDVSPEGIISWTNDKELPNPTPVNIRGKDGIDGEDGQSVYVSKITQNIVDGEYSSVEFSDGTSLKIKNGNTGSAGEQGENGLDGFSPTIDISKQGRITTLKITDKNGTRTTNINDGLDGENGENGTDGKDGISAYHEWDGTTLRITSASGTSSADLRGERGLQGIQGIQGEKGDPFFISKVYTSVVDMNNGYATDEVKIGQFVVIETGDVNDEDNAKLFIKGNYSYEFLTDLSGAQGMRGPAGIQGEQGIQGERGETGIGISSIVKSHTQGLVDTYTINYTDGSNTNFTVTNGINGKDGEKGANGTSVTVSSVSESSADGGSNVVTFSDGKTLTIKNGSRGSTGEKGDKGDKGDQGERGIQGEQGVQGIQGIQGEKGADGYTPVKYKDYFTRDDFGYGSKKILFMGDSITALGTGTRGWIRYFNEIISPASFANTAVNGARLCDYSDTVYDGNPVFNGSDSNHNNTLGNQVQKAIQGKASGDSNYSSFDVIMIAIGTNDSNPSGSIDASFYSNGAVVPVANVDRKTWHGAFRYCIEKLQDTYPEADIFICTPIQATEATRSYSSIKTKGNYLKQLCDRMSVNCIDTMRCGICGLYEVANAEGRDLVDGLHPNQSGATKIGNYNAREIIKHYLIGISQPDEPDEPEEPQNLVAISVDKDGNIYNGVGYRNDTYISSSSPMGYSSKSGYVSTGFFPAKNGDKLYSTGSAQFVLNDANCRVFVYDANKSFLGYLNAMAGDFGTGNLDGFELNNGYYDASNNKKQIESGIAFVRLAGKGTGDTFIVRTEPIA